MTDHIAILLRQLKDLQQDYDDGWVTSDEFKAETDDLINAMHELPHKE